MQNKTAFGAIVVASASAGLLLSASPALAQTAEDFQPNCATGALAYVPGLTSGTTSDAAPAVASTIVVTSGARTFTPGSAVTVTVRGVSVPADGPVDPSGSAAVTITVPSGPSTVVVLFRGTLNGSPNTVGVCFNPVTPIAGGGGGPVGQVPPPAGQPAPPVAQPIVGGGGGPARPSALPFTGSVELLAVAGLGAALVAAGAGTVVVARRRRSVETANA